MVFGPPGIVCNPFGWGPMFSTNFFPPVDYWTPCKDQSYPFRCAQSPCSNQHETSGVRITTAAAVPALQRVANWGPRTHTGSEPNPGGRCVRPQGGVYDQSLGNKNAVRTTAWHVLWHPKKWGSRLGRLILAICKKNHRIWQAGDG